MSPVNLIGVHAKELHSKATTTHLFKVWMTLLVFCWECWETTPISLVEAPLCDLRWSLSHTLKLYLEGLDLTEWCSEASPLVLLSLNKEFYSPTLIFRSPFFIALGYDLCLVAINFSIFCHLKRRNFQNLQVLAPVLTVLPLTCFLFPFILYYNQQEEARQYFQLSGWKSP